MIEDLLYISKKLLKSVELVNFTKEEEDYIVGVVRRIIFVLLIESHVN